jgi:PIN domain nuclease of toxin-antitoxin system
MPASIRRLISDRHNATVVSAASAWEMATKVRLGRLPAASDITRDFQAYLTQAGFDSLAVTAEHGIRAGLLPGPQQDPFDRMLIAQAQAESLIIVSNEIIFDQYGIRRVW